MARLKDVAELAGVSTSVVSRALTGDPEARVNAETRRRVQEAAETLNYVPDHRARALRLSRSGAIALVVPEVNNAIFASLYAGIHDVCQSRSTSVFLGQLDSPTEGPHALARLIGSGRVDGVILQRAENFDDDALATVIDIDVPVVLFNSNLDGHTGSVVIDDRGSVQIALEHLAGLGHRSVGFVSGAAVHDAARRRLAAFHETTTRLGLTVKPEWVQAGGWEAPAGAAAMNRILDQDDRPSAVLVASLNAAVGALSSALERGTDVPGEVSVMGIHDAWLARYVTPALTTVEVPMHTAGERVATMLLDHLDGHELSDTSVDDPPARLVVRASTGAPAGADR